MRSKWKRMRCIRLFYIVMRRSGWGAAKNSSYPCTLPPTPSREREGERSRDLVATAFRGSAGFGAVPEDHRYRVEHLLERHAAVAVPGEERRQGVAEVEIAQDVGRQVRGD